MPWCREYQALRWITKRGYEEYSSPRFYKEEDGSLVFWMDGGRCHKDRWSACQTLSIFSVFCMVSHDYRIFVVNKLTPFFPELL